MASMAVLFAASPSVMAIALVDGRFICSIACNGHQQSMAVGISSIAVGISTMVSPLYQQYRRWYQQHRRNGIIGSRWPLVSAAIAVDGRAASPCHCIGVDGRFISSIACVLASIILLAASPSVMAIALASISILLAASPSGNQLLYWRRMSRWYQHRFPRWL